MLEDALSAYSGAAVGWGGAQGLIRSNKEEAR